MSAPDKNNVGAADKIVVSHHTHRSRAKVRLASIIIGSIILLIVVILVTYVIIHLGQQGQSKSKQNQQEQTALISAVTEFGKANSDPSQLKTDADKLISGNQQHTYDLSNAQLATVYSYRADAELTDLNYTAASKDYQTAVKLDSSVQDRVAYQEIVARYHLGERKTLVPLLQTLVDELSKSKNNFDQQDAVRYAQYIQDLQNGQDLPL